MSDFHLLNTIKSRIFAGLLRFVADTAMFGLLENMNSDVLHLCMISVTNLIKSKHNLREKKCNYGVMLAFSEHEYDTFSCKPEAF